jgi:hypothetical protein
MSKTLMIMVGGVAALVILVGIGIGVFLFMPTIAGAIGNHATPTPTAAITTNNGTPTSNQKASRQYLEQYLPGVTQQLAQGLKLTSDQLTTQLKSGKTLTQIATDQKITGSQLNAIITNALQSSLQPAVTSGKITQKQLTNQIKRFQKNPDQLGHLLIAQAHKKGTPTP